MPLDLSRLSRRRASVAAPAPSEEFTKYKGHDESVDLNEKSDHTTPEVSHNELDESFDYGSDDDTNDIDCGYETDEMDDLSEQDEYVLNDDNDDNGCSADKAEDLIEQDKYDPYVLTPRKVSPILTKEEIETLFESESEEPEPEPGLELEPEEKEPELELEEELEEPEQEPELEQEPEPEPESPDPVEDDVKPERRFMFTPTPLVEETKLNRSFSYTIETFAIEVMNASEITNVSLSSFGDVSLIYEPDRLSLLRMGRHKFIGRPLSALDKQRLFYTLNEFLTKCEEDGRGSVTIKLTQRVFYRGVPYTSLVATESELSEYAGIFGKTIYFNPDEPDELNLVAVIKCME